MIDDCDYYILIIGGRYGSLTDEGISYTEKEYYYAISIGLKVLAFVHEQPDALTVDKSDIDPTLRHKLEEFRAKVTENRLVKFWRSASELPGLVALSLSKTIKVYPATGWIRASNAASDELLVDLNELRKENARLKADVAESESQFVPPDTDLAALEDSFSVNLVETFDGLSHTRSIAVSWSEVFSRIAPDLQQYPMDHIVNQRLGESLDRMMNWNPNHSGRVEIQHEDFQTIRVQLSALGLISTKYQEMKGGGMGLLWSLTKKGERLMTQLRTVKPTPKPLPNTT